MKGEPEQRARALAEYIVKHGATVRNAAAHFGCSKSTVHKDVAVRLKQLDPALAKEVRSVLDVNKQERHIRGGRATKEKYSRRLLGLSAQESGIKK